MMIGTIIAEELTSVGAYDCEIDGGVEYLWERGSFERKHLTGGEQSPDPGLDAMTYTDYLKSPAWQAIRQHALWAADWVCALCGTDQSLNVHHKWYPARGAETVKDLIVLCKPCHAKHHGKEA